jgi:hypothetical protein
VLNRPRVGAIYFPIQILLGGEKAPMLERFSRGGRGDLLRNHGRSSWNWPKLEYIIGLINATLEQSFPPRNSIVKLLCRCRRRRSLVGLRSNPTF